MMRMPNSLRSFTLALKAGECSPSHCVWEVHALFGLQLWLQTRVSTLPVCSPAGLSGVCGGDRHQELPREAEGREECPLLPSHGEDDGEEILRPHLPGPIPY